MSLTQSIGYGTVLHVVLLLAVCLHLLLKPRDARTSLLWIFFTAVFPFFGPFAYVLFGINTVPNKGWQKQYSDSTFQKRRRQSDRGAQLHAPRRDAWPATAPGDGLLAPLNRVLDHLSANHPLLGGNDIQLLEPAGLALEEMFLAIRQARHHVHLATYIFNDDAVGRRLMELLVEKARAGVQVRVLYDAFGSAGASLRLFFWRRRRIPNLTLIGFSQANVLKRKFQLNLRNHRKLLIIDGALAFTGGVNFHAVYLPRARDGRPGILDYHFRVRGPAVPELQYTFLRDWYYMTDQPAENLLAECFFPAPAPAGSMAVRLQNSGPTREETGAALDTFFAALSLARKQVLIVTPYFVPPEPLILALRQAAFRGVEVKIIVPSVNNHPTLQFASQALYAPLLLSGVRIFEREPPFNHAKAAVIDDASAIIGSANFDPRSLFLNYETNLVVFDAAFAARLKAAILADLARSHEIVYANWRRRSLPRKLAENFFNLFHPIA